MKLKDLIKEIGSGIYIDKHFLTINKHYKWISVTNIKTTDGTGAIHFRNFNQNTPVSEIIDHNIRSLGWNRNDKFIKKLRVYFRDRKIDKFLGV